jgi:hypothetical protein
MRKSVLAIVGLAVVIIVVAFVSNRRKQSAQSNPDTGPELAYQSATNASKLRPAPREFPASTNQQRVNNRTNPIPAAGVVANANYMTNWEEKLDAILSNNDTPDPQKAKEMTEMFPQLSPDAQEEIAHHISNLTPDENYNLGQFLTNSALPEAVLDVFTEDVLNRPNNIKLPLLLDVARDAQHPKAGEAKDILELFLEEDFGSDWTRWQAKLDQWLKDNPD